MDRLIKGFRRFHKTYYQDHREMFDTLVSNGQAPRAMVIACSDSRADPQLIFGSPPGEIFVVRNVANLVPPYGPTADYHGTSAALEFAVRTLAVEHIIVMGHTHCGGVNALLKQSDIPVGDFISDWMSIAAPARERALAATHDRPEDTQRTCEHETIKVSLTNLMTGPWIRARVERGELALHGWYFDLETGNLMRLGSEGTFEPVPL